MGYNKQEALNSLINPYKKSKVVNKSMSMRQVIGTISQLNRQTSKNGDFIQNKHQAKEKIKGVVKVPKTIYFGADMTQLKIVLSELDSFVVKPNHLSRGIGIRVMHKDGDVYRDQNGDMLTLNDIIDECKAIIRVKRYKGQKCIIVEELINSHSGFGNGGYADIRHIYYNNSLVFATGRFSNKESNGYANTNRGASYATYIHGVRMDDRRFQQVGDCPKKLPFWEEMALAGQRVSRLYGICFMSVDMTVNDQGEVVVLECERLPQIWYYLTNTGANWMKNIIGHNISVPVKSKMKRNAKKTGVPESYFR